MPILRSKFLGVIFQAKQILVGVHLCSKKSKSYVEYDNSTYFQNLLNYIVTKNSHFILRRSEPSLNEYIHMLNLNL